MNVFFFSFPEIWKGNNELQKNELKALDEVRKIIKEEKIKLQQ